MPTNGRFTASSAQGDRVTAHELELFMENDRAIYQREGSFILNAVRKKRRGTYGPARAPGLWIYLVDEGARAYNREFSKESGFGIFTRDIRMIVAESYARDFERRYDAGEFNSLDVRPGAPNPNAPVTRAVLTAE